MTSIPLLNLVKQEVSKNNQKIVRGTKKLNDFLEGLENRIADLENLKVEEIETNQLKLAEVKIYMDILDKFYQY